MNAQPVTRYFGTFFLVLLVVPFWAHGYHAAIPHSGTFERGRKIHTISLFQELIDAEA